MMRAARRSGASLLPLLLLSAALLAASPARALAQKPQEAERLAQKGAEYLGRRDWARARESYQKAVRADARNVEANYGLGVACMNLKQTTDALGAFSNVIEAQPNPRVKDALVYTGLIHFSLGHFKEASDAIGLAVPLGDIGPGGHYFLGKAYQQMGRDADALPHLQAALSEPQYAQDASLSVGFLLVKQGKGREAVAPLETAARLNPRNAQAMAMLGFAYLSAERPEEALAALRAADAITPGDFLTQLGLGFAHLSLYHNEEALAAFTAALRQQPASPEALTGLGGAYARTGRYREAEDALARALSAKPDSPDVLLAQCYLYYAQGQYTRLLDAARQAVRLAPQRADAQVLLGAALAITGDMEAGMR
ncbi:MAG TPA: tetratricopeptide repeat protein, partial [Pyrinomonadaceae bacterium]|nr:tetratricopeptide repeat protein [Pyrinomonadaceae bacterium]